VFDFLKKKINGFIEGLTKKEEQKEPEAARIPAPPEPAPEKAIEPVGPAKAPEPEERKPETRQKKPEPEAKKPARKAEALPPREIKKPEIRARPQEPKPERPVKPARQKEPEAKAEPVVESKVEEPQAEAPEPAQPKPSAGPRIRLSPLGAIRSIITNEVEITEGEAKGLLDDLELELLESDVDMGVAQGITAGLSEKLIGAKVKKGELQPFISSSIRQTLTDVLCNDKAFDLVERVEKGERPVKIMFIGINGAGKTTTIAKVAHLLMENRMKVVFAAADTFRAAAIEQMEVHAGKLGVKTIKRDYGSDPTSVAYDAVGYAKAHSLDAVLIDTAGRQDTNISLLNEIKKMDRVIRPDLKIYVGESIAGNAILEQLSSFNREVGIDAVILTKMDCDPKGGTMLSISKVTGIPIIYVGTGQAYADLEKFEPRKIAERIVG
jgi:fused signal recognition particle receptor